VRFGKLLFERNRDRTLDEISSLDGTVSKRKDSPYRSGRSSDWLKMKNSNAPAAKREAEEDWARGGSHECRSASRHLHYFCCRHRLCAHCDSFCVVGGVAMTGKNRIMIYGPKNDGTYIIDSRRPRARRWRSACRLERPAC
jgi:hypothetical protein